MTEAIADAPLLAVTFTQTQAEYLDLSERMIAQLPKYRGPRRRFRRMQGLFAGLLVWLFCPVGVATSGWRLVAAIAIGIVVAYLAGWLFDLLMRIQARRYTHERRLGDGPCVVTLTPKHLRVQHPHFDVPMAWPDVLNITDQGGDVEVRTRSLIFVVRARAFAQPADRARFLEIAKRCQADATKRSPV